MKKILSIFCFLGLTTHALAYYEGQDVVFKDAFMPDQVVEVLNTDTKELCDIRGGVNFKFLEQLNDNTNAIFVINQNFGFKNTDCPNGTFFISSMDIIENYKGENHFAEQQKKYFKEMAKERKSKISSASSEANKKLMTQSNQIFKRNLRKINKFIKSQR